jgi:hypothetical protein
MGTVVGENCLEMLYSIGFLLVLWADLKDKVSFLSLALDKVYYNQEFYLWECYLIFYTVIWIIFVIMFYLYLW